jgi:hypothetical protein
VADKVVFLKPGLPHFREWIKNRLVVEKTHCNSPKMYTSSRSCWIMILVLLAPIFGEAILKTSKIHNSFIQYPNNTYFSVLESS